MGCSADAKRQLTSRNLGYNFGTTKYESNKIQGMKLISIYLIFLALFSLREAFRLPAFSRNLWGARVTTNLSTNRVGSKNEWVSVVKRNDLSPGDILPVEVDGLALLVAADLAGEFSIVSSFLLFLWVHELTTWGWTSLYLLMQGRFMPLTMSVHLLELL